MEDQQIIALYWQRDESAIQESSRKYGALCQRIALNILSRIEDAEECVNDTWQRAWQAMPPERPHSLKAWLGRVTRNLALNRWQKNRAQKRYNGLEQLLSELEDCLPSGDDVEQSLEAKELGRYISRWLDGQSPLERALFLRRYWFGDSLQDLAREAGVSPSQLAGTMRRLRLSLKAALEKEGICI